MDKSERIEINVGASASQCKLKPMEDAKRLSQQAQEALNGQTSFGSATNIAVGEGDLEAWQEAQAQKLKAEIESISRPNVTFEDLGSSGKEICKHAARKQFPVFSGVLQYFPDAIFQVAKCSKIGNDQHNDPSLPMHWDRNKSTDEPDALVRHLMQFDQLDDDGILHAVKVAWRSLALLQKCLEQRGEAPLSKYDQGKVGKCSGAQGSGSV